MFGLSILEEVKSYVKHLGSNATKEHIVQKCAELLWKQYTYGDVTDSARGMDCYKLEEYRFYSVDYNIGRKLSDKGEMVFGDPLECLWARKLECLWARKGGGLAPWDDPAFHAIAEDFVDDNFTVENGKYRFKENVQSVINNLTQEV